MSYVSSRATYGVVDELGSDPLRDPSFDAIQKVTSYTYFSIDESLENNAAKISSMVYGTNAYWWAILAYNGIPDNFSLKRGMRLRIPNLNELTSALSNVDIVNTTRTVEI
jgi:hypothetical protein